MLIRRLSQRTGYLSIPPIEAWFGARFPKEMEISKVFLDLQRSAAKKDPELQATRDAVLRKNEKNRGLEQSPRPRESMAPMRPVASRMPEIAIKDS
jgi:hypothetical protein